MPLRLFIAAFCLVCALSPLRTSASLGGFVSLSEDRAQKIEQRRSIGSGTRSQCQSSFPKDTITLLVPQEKVVHKASSSRPSFYLKSSVATSPTSVKFTLTDPDTAKPLAQQELTLSQSGIKQIELPKQVKLKQGKIYLWYVAIPCGQNRLDSMDTENTQYQDILASSVEFVPVPSKIDNKLKTAEDDTATAKIYAQNGYWYDSLATSIKSKSTFLEPLLKSVNLN